MFEGEFKNLSNFDVYTLSVYALQDLYFFANGAYSEALHEIEFKRTQNQDYYLRKLSQYRHKLESDYNIVKTLKSQVVKLNLNQHEQQTFNSHKELFKKVQKLLINMDKFLSQHTIDVSV